MIFRTSDEYGTLIEISNSNEIRAWYEELSNFIKQIKRNYSEGIISSDINKHAINTNTKHKYNLILVYLGTEKVIGRLRSLSFSDFDKLPEGLANDFKLNVTENEQYNYKESITISLVDKSY